MRLGTTVQIMGYRPPLQSAKFWVTLDQLSENRAILGVGAAVETHAATGVDRMWGLGAR